MNLRQPTVPDVGSHSLAFSTRNSSMYSPQEIKPPTGCEMENMYSKNRILSTDNDVPNMMHLKKDNILHTVFNAVVNLFGEYLFKASVSFITNMNNSLSVTVASNQNVISEDFFKSLTENKENLATRDSRSHSVRNKELLIDNMYIATVSSKKFPVADRNISHCRTIKGSVDIKVENSLSKFKQLSITCDELLNRQNLFDCVTFTSKNAMLMVNDGALRMKDSCLMRKSQNIDYMRKKITYVHEKEMEDSLSKEEIVRVVNILRNRETSRSKYLGPNSKISSKLMHTSSEPTRMLNHPVEIVPQEESFSEQVTLSNLLTNMWHKVVDSASDRLCIKYESPDLEMAEKQSHSPRSQPKPNVARSYGRGRAKSQLRWSGVSQSRRRHVQMRQNLAADIQEYFYTWETFGHCHTLQYDDVSYIPNSKDDLQNHYDVPVTQCSTYSMSINAANVTHREPNKQKSNQVIKPELNKFSIRYGHEAPADIDIIFQNHNKNEYEPKSNLSRSRTISESSVDSEDSFCIVFENETESDYETDYEESSDEEEEHCTIVNKTPQKVKFNLKPEIHTMIQWNYAYRAARKGPWEQIARDRERFKHRIYFIGQVLDPVLTAEHRNRIWQERFNIQK